MFHIVCENDQYTPALTMGSTSSLFYQTLDIWFKCHIYSQIKASTWRNNEKIRCFKEEINTCFWRFSINMSVRVLNWFGKHQRVRWCRPLNEHIYIKMFDRSGFFFERFEMQILAVYLVAGKVHIFLARECVKMLLYAFYFSFHFPFRYIGSHSTNIDWSIMLKAGMIVSVKSLQYFKVEYVWQY